MGRQLNITLTPAQVDFVKENYLVMKRTQMQKHLGISKGILDGNMYLMNLRLKKPTRPKLRQENTAGFFDVNRYYEKNLI
jgi:hypothetical protein